MASLPTSPTLLAIKPDPTLLFFFPLRPPRSHYPHFSLLPRTTNTRISTTVTLCSSSSSGDSSNPLFRTTPANFTASSNGDYLFVGESSPDGEPAARVVDDWGETAEPETGPTTKLSDADPPKEEDEWGRVVVDGATAGVVDEWGESGEPETEPPTKLSEADPPKDEDEWGGGVVDDASPSAGVVDEWGERGEQAVEPATKLSEADPPRDEDEWGGGVGVGGDYVFSGGGGIAGDKLMELKRCLVDTVYGTDFGFRASAEVRAEALELVSQLEAANPTPAPAEAVEVLDGDWVLVYTAFSELLPLLAAGTTPLLKVERICQAISTNNLTVENSVKLSSPFATLSFSASAKFEVQTPTRIQVEFKEGTLQPPEIKSSIELPDNVDIFGQKISLSPVQQTLDPLQGAVASVARAISGQPPVKVPIPGERTKSWLLITYLDKDLRISRGDGGLFVLVKEGSPLLD